MRLREADQDASAGALDELKGIVAQIREQGKETRIVIRADSGFWREEPETVPGRPETPKK